MGRRKDLSGNIYNRITVNNFAYMKGGCSYWDCTCSCGTVKTIRGSSLTCGNTESCGCITKELNGKDNNQETHGMLKTSEYSVWTNMKTRCNNKNNDAYSRYGGRGITVCDGWNKDFMNFYMDMGDRPEGLTLERINNDKGYSKDNCKWATAKEQANNRRTENLCIGVKGEGNNKSVMSDLQIMMARVAKLYTRISGNKLAKKYGIGSSSMSKILQGKSRQIVYGSTA